ncbi:hypothetical protein FE810_13815 [Thalassotalea litorea]|uniref:Uncharacterized protein n=1 Tax=Thalassotalea litorea TaxID=2020715 RepID=A0A5R9II98_9GAMM|nr:hypothetical protein [Thalassotalea litorea]TLU61888.1 hypothetical protein FE810_13815 [Thalassotalea litorea]
MRKLLVYLALFSFNAVANPNQIKVEVDDCGPLARDELGVVFSLKPHGEGKSYFADGTANELCPKLTSAKYILGYEEDLCKNYKPRNEKECGAVKVFVIQQYIYK